MLSPQSFSRAAGEKSTAIIALVRQTCLGERTLSTEPLIIPVHLSGIPGRPLLQLLDSGASVPLLYDAGKDIAGGFSVSAPIHDRGPDGAEHIFSVLPRQDMQIGALAFHQIPFVSLATGKEVPKVEVEGLLPTALFRSVYISYSDRFVILEQW